MIIYYGPSGHGKGLIDAMSAFGVKGPLLKAVLTKDFKYNSTKDIYEYLKELFKDDNQKLFFHIPIESTVNHQQDERKPVPIPGWVKESHHMICFKPDGTIISKTNICSCNDCLEGNFMECCIEKGKLVMAGDDSDDDSTNSETEYEYDEFKNADDETELYELRSETVV